MTPTINAHVEAASASGDLLLTGTRERTRIQACGGGPAVPALEIPTDELLALVVGYGQALGLLSRRTTVGKPRAKPGRPAGARRAPRSADKPAASAPEPTSNGAGPGFADGLGLP